MTKSKAYYQAFLVLSCLSKEEYSLIPEELLDEIKTKMEVDEDIKIDSNIPIEKQKIDDKAYDILDRVIKSIEKKYGKDAIYEPQKYAKDEKNAPKSEKMPQKSAEITQKDPKLDNLELKNITNALEEEKEKVEKAKNLIIDYKEVIEQKDARIRELKEEIESLKEDNVALNSMIQKVPGFLRKIFIKDDIKMLKG